MSVSPESLELAQVVIALVLLGFSLVCLPMAYVQCWREWEPSERRWVGGAVAVGAITRWLLAPHLLAMIFIGYKQTEHALALLEIVEPELIRPVKSQRVTRRIRRAFAISWRG